MVNRPVSISLTNGEKSEDDVILLKVSVLNRRMSQRFLGKFELSILPIEVGKMINRWAFHVDPTEDAKYLNPLHLILLFGAEHPVTLFDVLKVDSVATDFYPAESANQPLRFVMRHFGNTSHPSPWHRVLTVERFPKSDGGEDVYLFSLSSTKRNFETSELFERMKKCVEDAYSE
jgi:hypothetical protein